MAAVPADCLPRTDSGASTDTATCWGAAGAPNSGQPGQQEAAYGTWPQQTQLQVDDANIDAILENLLPVQDLQPVNDLLPGAPPPPIVTAEDVLQHKQSCSSCQLLRAEGEKLHGSIVAMQGGARLGTLQAQQIVEVLVKATRGCQQASSSSSGSACSDSAGSRLPCLLMGTAQLLGSLWSWGAWYAKARMAPEGKKRAANGTSLPWNLNFGANAPMLLPQPERVWDLLQAQGSSTSNVPLSESAAGAAGQTSTPELYCIRSRSKQLVAVALACHDSSSSDSMSPPSISTAALAGLFPSTIICRKKGNPLQGKRLMLYPFVCVFRDETEAAAGAVVQKKPRTQL